MGAHVAITGGDVGRMEDAAAEIPGIGATRGVPDEAANADFDSGLVIRVRSGSREVIGPAGGTSAGAPMWAASWPSPTSRPDRDLGFVNPAI